MCDESQSDPSDEEEATMITENYLRLFGAAWDNIEEAAEEIENGIWKLGIPNARNAGR